MVLYRIGGGATPLPPQPNPIYYSLTSTTSSGSSSGGSTTTTTTKTTTTTTPPPQPSTGLSSAIASEVAAMNTPPPTVPTIPALGPNFVGWAPWQLIQQWGSAALLRQYLDLLRQQEELRQQLLEEMAREGLPVTPVPIITEQETTRPIGLRVHYIPM